MLNESITKAITTVIIIKITLGVAEENGVPLAGMGIVDAPDVITMEEHAGEIMRSKKDCSMAVGLKLLAEGKGDAFITAGSTGALVVGATRLVKRIKGITHDLPPTP